MRHQNPRQTCSDLLIINNFPLLANDAAKPPSPATHRATYLVINKEKESHACEGHAEKLIDKSAARGGWLRRPVEDRLVDPRT